MQFPSSYDDPAVATIPWWPEWEFFDDQAPRSFWLTRLGTGIYQLGVISGPLEMVLDLDVDHEVVHYVTLSQLTPEAWGWSPGLLSVKTEDADQLMQRLDAMKRDLPVLLAIHAI